MKKQKIPYPQNYCKSVVPDDYIRAMKKALKEVEYGDSIIGPKTFLELSELNSDNTGYSHCIFDEIIKNKLIQDYNTIKDGLELLKFYKSNNTYFRAFDYEITEIYKSIPELDREFTDIVEVNVGNLKLTELNDKTLEIWEVYFDGVKGVGDKFTFDNAMVFAKNSMFYNKYNKIRIVAERN